VVLVGPIDGPPDRRSQFVSVSWHRQSISFLRMPPVCAATGRPATTSVQVVFRKQWTMYLPGIGRIIANLTNRPVMITLPVTAEVERAVRSARMLAVAPMLAIFAAGFGLAALLDSLLGSLLLVLLIAAGAAWSLIFSTRANIFRTDVNGDWISMRRAAPAFVQALVTANPPGLVRTDPWTEPVRLDPAPAAPQFLQQPPAWR
jgi:hypothetical protein